jgi:hypothetical protein
MSLRPRPLVRHSACGVLLALLLTINVDATTLAIIRTGDEIVIAADSLMTLYGRRPQLTCKIRRHGDVVFATAGLVSTSDGRVEFHTVITNILRRQLPWPEQARQVEEWLKEPLLRTLRRMQRELPEEFQAQLSQGFTLHVSLAGIHGGGPALEIREYFVERAADETLRLRVDRLSCPGSCPHPTEVFGIGETDEMMRRVAQFRHLPSDLPALAYDLVSAEIAQHPEHVGPPVDVIRVSRTGVAWVRLKAACPA